ncbi:MAG: hypothetical protein KA116_09195 [Proteobacteria bacterium]|nr:hypothetical protein [Pseudomonadota bacterium]
MKKIFNVFMGVSAGLLSFNLLASSQYRVEIGVARVFIPANGFDDNDTVEAVLDGELPNSCFALEKSVVDVNAAEKTITVHQFAIRVTAGICDPKEVQDVPQLMTPVPYSVTVTVGQLAAGNYKINFAPNSTQNKIRNFKVDVAKVPSIDSRPYAKVTQVIVDDIIGDKDNVKVEIRGVLNNSCYELDRIDVDTQDDVTILLPTVTVKRAPTCLMVLRPFTATVDLGAMGAAHRMIHVRSAEGKSLNHTFQVKASAER